MKKLKIFAVILAIALVVCVFTACGQGDALSGTVTIVVRGTTDSTFTVDLEEAELTAKDNVTDAMRFLAHNDESFTFAGSESIYGLYLSQVCGLSGSATHFIAVFTSVEADKGTFEGVVSVQAGGKTCYTSGVGVSSMKLEDGAVYLFMLEEMIW